MPHELAKANRPDQFNLLERATDLFTASQVVTHLLVRGSLASGTADRLSDVDFVVGVDDLSFPGFISVLDALASADLGGILPGWRDTIVGDMGGLGYVYLVSWAGHLPQVDLYVVPASQVGRVHKHTVAHSIFIRDADAAYEPDLRVAPFVARTMAEPRSCADLLIETLVIGYLMRKRIIRGQEFIAYSEAHLFLDDTHLVITMGGGVGTLHELTAALWYSGNIRSVPVWLVGEIALRLLAFRKAERWLFESPTRPLRFLREVPDLATFHQKLSALLRNRDERESSRPAVSRSRR